MDVAPLFPLPTLFLIYLSVFIYLRPSALLPLPHLLSYVCSCAYESLLTYGFWFRWLAKETAGSSDYNTPRFSSSLVVFSKTGRAILSLLPFLILIPSIIISILCLSGRLSTCGLFTLGWLWDIQVIVQAPVWVMRHHLGCRYLWRQVSMVTRMSSLWSCVYVGVEGSPVTVSVFHPICVSFCVFSSQFMAVLHAFRCDEVVYIAVHKPPGQHNMIPLGFCVSVSLTDLPLASWVIRLRNGSNLKREILEYETWKPHLYNHQSSYLSLWRCAPVCLFVCDTALQSTCRSVIVGCFCHWSVFLSSQQGSVVQTHFAFMLHVFVPIIWWRCWSRVSVCVSSTVCVQSPVGVGYRENLIWFVYFISLLIYLLDPLLCSIESAG